MDSRRVGPAIRRRLGAPSGMYNETQRMSPPAGDVDWSGGQSGYARQAADHAEIDSVWNPDVNVQPGPGGAEYQGNVEEPLSAPQVGPTHVQGSYTPPLMPEVNGGPTGITGTLRGNPQETSGERNGVHRGYDAETDYEAMFDYFGRR